MKNFDDHRAKKLTREQRTFVIGGETFVARASVRPEAFMRWDDLDMEETSATEIIAVGDETIIAMLEADNDAHNRYRALRAREDDALSLTDITDLIQWLVEVQSGGRPTAQQSGSSGSPGATGESSTGASSSQESQEELTLSTSGSS